MADGDRWVRRGKAAVRATLYDIKKNPLKAGWSLAQGAIVGVAMESIPQLRDSKAALIFGTGVDDRLHSALKQFEAAYDDVKSQMHKIQHIEVSVFGADRGGVLARAFVNELVRKYGNNANSQLHIGTGTVSAAPIEIKFLGLLDAVSSIMEENKLLDVLPLAGMIKQNFKDQPLGVPSAVQKCVHFAAAHELRFYQRLDSLEKTRGEQYLYPGTSEDVTGGAPPGALGMRAELQRFVLRDMLNEALTAGSAVDKMEDQAVFKPEAFRKFSLAAPITEGTVSYKIGDLMAAYRKLVPYQKGLDFQAHQKVFLQWLAARYQSPGFRDSVTKQGDDIKRQHQAAAKERADAEAAYQAERARSPVDQLALGQAMARMMAAQNAEQQQLRTAVHELARPMVSVWERLESEAAQQMARLDQQHELKSAAEKIRDFNDKSGLGPYYTNDFETSATTVEAMQMPPEARALAQAWKDAVDGKAQKLDDKIMALFDLLVHDTMLTSWHDHVLSNTLYFQTRATDTFGVSDQKKAAEQEEAKRKQAELARQRIDAVRRAREMRPGRGASPVKKLETAI
jgi:signal transduction histidine kinase